MSDLAERIVDTDRAGARWSVGPMSDLAERIVDTDRAGARAGAREASAR